MTREELLGLSVGDIVRHRMSGNAHFVLANFTTYALAVRVMTITNPSEWELVESRETKRIKELESALKEALSILGHPDDATIRALHTVLKGAGG